tara:strand:- start:246 stop:419 length:174 start_codon:yes stop_codon:yes gene_type:complete
MSLIKILAIIMSIWLIFKVKRFISGIHITSGKPEKHQNQKNRHPDMDIQDADYEDVE